MSDSKNFLMDMIQNEISSMAGGSVQGYSLPLGAKPDHKEETRTKRNFVQLSEKSVVEQSKKQIMLMKI